MMNAAFSSGVGCGRVIAGQRPGAATTAASLPSLSTSLRDAGSTWLRVATESFVIVLVFGPQDLTDGKRPVLTALHGRVWPGGWSL